MFTLATGGTIQGVAGTNNVLTCTVFGMELSGGVETYKVLVQAQIANSVGIIGSYTVAASTIALVKRIQIANTTSSPVTGLILYVNGSAAGNQITGSLTIPANGTMVMSDLGTLVYDASGNLLLAGQNFVTPAVVLGTAGSAGTTTNTIRSDSTIAAFDATVPAVTTPAAVSTVGSVAFSARRDHTHQSPGGVTSNTSDSSAINTADTNIVGFTIPANFCTAGTTFRIRAAGTCVCSHTGDTSTFVARMGTANTNSDAALVTITSSSVTGATTAFDIEILVTVRTIGASITVEAGGMLKSTGTTGIGAGGVVGGSVNSHAAINTTVQEFLTLWYVTNATTTTSTFNLATIEVVKM